MDHVKLEGECGHDFRMTASEWQAAKDDPLGRLLGPDYMFQPVGNGAYLVCHIALPPKSGFFRKDMPLWRGPKKRSFLSRLLNRK